MRSRLVLFLIFLALLTLVFQVASRDREGTAPLPHAPPSAASPGQESPDAPPSASTKVEPPGPRDPPRGRLVVRACREADEHAFLSGARVEVRWEDGAHFSGRTNEAGELRFDDVPAGPIRTTVSADGFFPERREYDRVPEGGLEVVTARLQKSRALAGRVVSAADGSTIAGAEVRAFTTAGMRLSDDRHWSAGHPAGRSTTGPDGRFALPAVPGDAGWGLLVYVEAAGFRTTRHLLQKLPEPTGEFSVPLAPGGRVVGRVRDSGGKPLGGVRVIATPMDCLDRVGKDRMVLAGELEGAKELVFPIHTLTDERGDYELPGVGRGDRYAVRFERAGFAVRTERDVQITSSRPITELSVSLSPGGSLLVTVTDPSGVPIEGAQVTSWHQPTLHLTEASTDRKGVARFSPVFPGPRTIRAGVAGGSNAMLSFTMPGSGDGACTLVLTRGDPSRPARPSLGSGRESLTGTVTFPDGCPVTGGSVHILALDRSTDLDGDGSFRLDRLPAGVHQIEAMPFYARHVTSEATVPGPPSHLVVRRHPEIRGTIAVPTGAPPPGHFTLSASPGLGATWNPWEPPDARRITFARRAVPGTTKLVIEFPGYAKRSWTGTVPESGWVDAGEFVLDPGRVLSGRVVDEAGRPVPHAEVGLWRTTWAGTDGRFRMPGVPPGRHALLATAPGFLLARVDIPAGVDDVRIVLSRGTVMPVLVRDRFGDAVPRVRVSILEVGPASPRRFSESRHTPTTGRVEFLTPPGEFDLTAVRPGVPWDSPDGRVAKRITVAPKAPREPVVLTLP